MTAMTLGRRALEFLIEPPPSEPVGRASLEIGVLGLSRECGASTVARGLALELPRAHVADGARPGPSGVLVAVADGGAVPVLAGLVAERLAVRQDRVLLVANRPDDPLEWARAGALCVPASRVGVLLLSKGRRARGSMGSALRELGRRIQE